MALNDKDYEELRDKVIAKFKILYKDSKKAGDTQVFRYVFGGKKAFIFLTFSVLQNRVICHDWLIVCIFSLKILII